MVRKDEVLSPALAMSRRRKLVCRRRLLVFAVSAALVFGIVANLNQLFGSSAGCDGGEGTFAIL